MSSTASSSYRLNANIGTGETHSIRYGVVAARIKFNPLQGQHASLWMQPTNINGSTDPAVQGTEIDIIEWFGKDTPSGGLTSFIYAPSYGGKKIGLGGDGWIKKPEQYLMNEKDDFYKRYHVYSVEWTSVGLHLPHRRPGDRPDHQGQQHLASAPSTRS